MKVEIQFSNNKFDPVAFKNREKIFRPTNKWKKYDNTLSLAIYW